MQPMSDIEFKNNIINYISFTGIEQVEKDNDLANLIKDKLIN